MIQNFSNEPFEICFDVKVKASLAINIPAGETWSKQDIKEALEIAASSLENALIDIDCNRGSANLTAMIIGLENTDKVMTYNRESGDSLSINLSDIEI